MSGTEDGTKAYPYNTIQEGLTAAPVDWQVWVDDSGGTYAGPVTLMSGVILKSVNWDPGDGTDQATILGGSPAAVVGADNATIDGFIIDGDSCGIDCNATSPEILNCRVVNIRGGNCRAIWLRNNSYAHLDGVEVYDCDSAGLYVSTYGIVVENCDVSGGQKVVIEHLRLHYIYSSGLLGGSYGSEHALLISGSDGVEVRNSIIWDVTAGNYGNSYGIIMDSSADVEIENVTIYNIVHGYYYGTVYGLYFSNCTNLDVRNSIIDHITRGGQGYYVSAYGVANSNSTYVFEYNDVYDCSNANYTGATPGVGCISADPKFVAPGTDFHLAVGSPCINTGDPAIHDPDNSQSDMGAYGGPDGGW
jgi:hypothetical protein